MCVPAGLFMPTMFVGAKFGGATGFGVYWFLEHVAGQPALAQTIQPVQPQYLQCAATGARHIRMQRTNLRPRSAPPRLLRKAEAQPPERAVRLVPAVIQ